VAKAKTPSSGDDTPKTSSTSRASAAAAKPKTTAKKTGSSTATKPAGTTAKPSTAKPKPAAKTSAASADKTATGKASDDKASAKPESVKTTDTAPSAAKASDAKEATTATVKTGGSDTAAKAASPATTANASTSAKPETKPSDTKSDAKPDAKDVKPDTASDKPATPAPKPATSTASTTSAKPATPTKTPPPVTPVAEPEKRGSVFWPMLFGGIIAGGIGFAVAEYDLLEQAGLRPADTSQSNLSDTIAAQEARIKALEETDPAPAPTDDAALQEVQALVAELATRVDDLGNRPATEAPAPVDTSAFEEELAALQSSVETQRDEIQRLLDNALSVEEATAQAAQAATLQSALGRIVSAVTTGQPFEAEIADLKANGIQDVPPALADTAATGVVTAANLQDRFPDAARASLAAARAASPDVDGGGIGGFFKQQLGARSVAPRDGDDPDAILSRAEAAMRDGRLADALAEVKALPPEAQEPLSEWLSDAQARHDAQDAVQTLTQRLTAN
jgi:hypothetical protein